MRTPSGPAQPGPEGRLRAANRKLRDACTSVSDRAAPAISTPPRPNSQRPDRAPPSRSRPSGTPRKSPNGGRTDRPQLTSADTAPGSETSRHLPLIWLTVAARACLLASTGLATHHSDAYPLRQHHWRAEHQTRAIVSPLQPPRRPAPCLSHPLATNRTQPTTTTRSEAVVPAVPGPPAREPSSGSRTGGGYSGAGGPAGRTSRCRGRARSGTSSVVISMIAQS